MIEEMVSGTALTSGAPGGNDEEDRKKTFDSSIAAGDGNSIRELCPGSRDR
jgi:hypothetical protein